MGWKNVKDYYRIEHIVRVEDDDILIGSSYVPCLLKISRDCVVSWGTLGPGHDNDLLRYRREMVANLEKLSELMKAPDTFSESLPVFTYDDGKIIEKRCEAYGWPNITHDGEIMHDNTFSPNRDQVVEWAKENALAGIRIYEERLADLYKKIAETKGILDKHVANLSVLEKEAGERTAMEVRECK